MTIEADELPFPVRFDFLRLKDDDLGAISFEYLGYAIESGPVSSDSVAGVDLDGFGPTAEQLRWLRENVGTYHRHGAMRDRDALGSHSRTTRVRLACQAGGGAKACAGEAVDPA